MKLLLPILLSSILLVGCAKPEPTIIYKTETVEIPVYQIPKFQIPPKPILPTDLLVKTDKPPTIGKAYVSTKIILEGYVDKLINILRAIKKPEQ